MRFRKRKGYGRFNYRSDWIVKKWYGFCGRYKGQADICWTGSSYFCTIKIIDLNWTDCKGDKHTYAYQKHQPTIGRARQFCKFLLNNPINYIKEEWRWE